MLSLATHPNVGAVLCVGLGCEYTQPERLAQVVEQSGRPAAWFFIQESGGTIGSIAKGKAAVRALRDRIRAETPKVPMGPADLVIGSECGGSDFTSGLVGNRVVGEIFDRLVDSGGTAVFEEIVELVGLRDTLVTRGATEEAGASLRDAHDKALEYCRSVAQYSVSPGNFAGGLTTIEEKSAGAYAKSGSRPIQGVIKVAQKPPSPGLWLLDSVPDPHYMQFGFTNPNDTEGIMDLISIGSHIVLFVTGRGSVIGSPVAPLIKITGNTHTYEKMQSDIDFNAGPVLEGKMSMADAAEDLLRLVVDTAAGRPTKPEQLGHREYFVMYKHQDVPDLATGCRA
jgi:altronate hydrolase